MGGRSEKKRKGERGKGGGKERRGRKERKNEQGKKEENGGCSWPVGNTLRVANPTRRRSAGRLPGNRWTGAPNSVRKQERKRGEGNTNGHF
jgi:hypothetical protein